MIVTKEGLYPNPNEFGEMVPTDWSVSPGFAERFRQGLPLSPLKVSNLGGVREYRMTTLPVYVKKCQ